MPTIQMNDSCPDEHLSSAASIVLSLWFSLSGFATVAGNAVVLWLFYRNESLRTTSNGFLTSLSVTDFLVGLVIDPVWIVIRCLIQPPVHSALHYSLYMLWIHTTTATTFNLCCVSVDRFIAIRFPFRYQDIVTKKRCCTVIILVWLISLCLPFTAISVDLLGNIASAVLWLSLAFVTFLAPLFVVTFCYMFMFKASRRQCRKMFPNENRQSFDTKNIPGNGTMKNFKAIEDGRLYFRCLHCFLDAQSGLTRSSLLLYSDESSLLRHQNRQSCMALGWGNRFYFISDQPIDLLSQK